MSASFDVGQNSPVSMELIVFLETPMRCASSFCVSPASVRASLSRFRRISFSFILARPIYEIRDVEDRAADEEEKIRDVLPRLQLFPLPEKFVEPVSEENREKHEPCARVVETSYFRDDKEDEKTHRGKKEPERVRLEIEILLPLVSERVLAFEPFQNFFFVRPCIHASLLQSVLVFLFLILRAQSVLVKKKLKHKKSILRNEKMLFVSPYRYFALSNERIVFAVFVKGRFLSKYGTFVDMRKDFFRIRMDSAVSCADIGERAPREFLL